MWYSRKCVCLSFLQYKDSIRAFNEPIDFILNHIVINLAQRFLLPLCTFQTLFRNDITQSYLKCILLTLTFLFTLLRIPIATTYA